MASIVEPVSDKALRGKVLQDGEWRINRTTQQIEYEICCQHI